MQIGTLLQMPIPTKTNARNQILNEIHALCHTDIEARLVRPKNISRYKLWLKEKKLKHSYEVALRFKDSSKCLKPLTKKQVGMWLSHVKEVDDLYVVLSMCKDKLHRGFAIGSYLFDLGNARKY